LRCAGCPVPAGSSCLGEAVPRLCELARARDDYRRQLARHAARTPAAAAPASTSDLAVILAAVNACPDRGGALPVALQPECGCAELTECRAGLGSRPGRVTLADCLACRAARARPGRDG